MVKAARPDGARRAGQEHPPQADAVVGHSRLARPIAGEIKEPGEVASP